MRIERVTDASFAPYGRICGGHTLAAFLYALNTATPLPAGTNYVPQEPALETLPDAAVLGPALYGGMPVQFGWCNGHNTKLNCLEYHRDSEFNLGTEDFILLVATLAEVKKGKLDTAKVKAFWVPAGVLVEVYATTLHYAPCQTDAKKGFRVMIALPRGTNTEKPHLTDAAPENRLLWAQNKWLLAHPDSAEAAAGAWIGLTGENITLADTLS